MKAHREVGATGPGASFFLESRRTPVWDKLVEVGASLGLDEAELRRMTFLQMAMVAEERGGK